MGFWVLIAGLTAALLIMTKPFFEMVGLIVIGIAWVPLYLHPTEPWFVLFAFVSLVLTAAPLVWIGRILTEAYRHTSR